MADVTISGLPIATVTRGNALLPVANGGTTKSIPVSSILYSDSSRISLLSSTLTWDTVPAGSPGIICLQLNNGDIRGLNNLYWNETGPYEGLTFPENSNSNNYRSWHIFVSPDNLTDNTGLTGNLQFIQGPSGGSNFQTPVVYRRMTLQQDGQLSVYGTVSAQKSFSLDGVSDLAWAGYSAGNSVITHKARPEIGGPFKIEATFSHYGYVNTYGCTYFAAFALGGAPWSIKDITTYYNSNNGTAGNWSVTWDNTDLVISKSAGSYNGQGYYWIKLTGLGVSKIS